MNTQPAKGTLPTQVFEFSGQTELTTWTLTDRITKDNWTPYEDFLTHEPVLCFQRIRHLADAFPTHQRIPDTGRRPIDERTHLIAMLVRQFLDATFRELKAWLELLADFFDIEHVPGASTLSEKNRSQRFTRLLKRLHAFLLDQLPAREAVLSTDATGYGNEKLPWSRASYTLRATQGWIKAHCAVELPSLLIVSTVLTPGNVHESQVFADVWSDLPDNLSPKRSLADAAYSGTDCLETARAHGATPLHCLRSDASATRLGEGAYTKLVWWAHQFPNRFARLTGPRALVETAFNCVKQRFGFQLRCRDPRARRNAIMAKHIAHNIRMLTVREACASP